MMTDPSQVPQTLNEYESMARKQLSEMVYGYYSSGADDQISLRENQDAYSRIKLRPRILMGVGERDTQVHLKALDVTLAAPIGVAPMAFQKMAHPDGEAGVARAVGARGLVMTLSTLANTTIEDVAAAATGPMWYQLYVYRDRGVTRSLVERAEAAGYRALVLTVDAPLMGRRIADSHNRFELPPGLSIANFSGAAAKLESQEGKSGLSAYTEALIDPNLTWRDVEWLASITSLPVVVKGVLRGDDAEHSLDYGVKGVVVSNHGARQLDTVPATIEVLPEIAHAIGGRADVLIDGGVRRGTDVIKALALGADMVLVGRPLLWGLTLGGEAGAGRVLDLLLTELDLAMALCGCRSVADVTPDLVFS